MHVIAAIKAIKRDVWQKWTLDLAKDGRSDEAGAIIVVNSDNTVHKEQLVASNGKLMSINYIIEV